MGFHSLGFVVWIFALWNSFGRQCFLAEDSLLSSLPFFLIFGYIYLIVTLVPVVFGFSMHLLGCHCPLSFGCAIFECGGVLVPPTRSTLTTLGSHSFLDPLVPLAAVRDIGTLRLLTPAACPLAKLV